MPYLFFQNLKDQDLWAKIFQIAAVILLWIVINLINDDAFVLAVTADACFMVHLVCLLMKMHTASIAAR